MSKRIVYKVVSVNDRGHLMSAMVLLLPYNYPVRYVPGQETTARYPGHRLMAFETKRQTNDFVIGGISQVWRAEAEDARKISSLPYFHSPSFAGFWARFKQAVSLNRFPSFRSEQVDTSAPDGTLACSSIKLIERVG